MGTLGFFSGKDWGWDVSTLIFFSRDRRKVFLVYYSNHRIVWCRGAKHRRCLASNRQHSSVLHRCSVFCSVIFLPSPCCAKGASLFRSISSFVCHSSVSSPDLCPSPTLHRRRNHCRFGSSSAPPWLWSSRPSWGWLYPFLASATPEKKLFFKEKQACLLVPGFLAWLSLLGLGLILFGVKSAPLVSPLMKPDGRPRC